MEPEFREWPKIPRGQNENITITEKIDGSNAAIIIDERMNDEGVAEYFIAGVQSRKRLIYPNHVKADADNFAFALWVEENTDDLLSLETGYHYGEWAGPGIQKNPHGLEKKEFFLFNTHRWNPDNPNKPDCCSVVPQLYHGLKLDDTVDQVMQDLALHHELNGTKGEGVIVYYHKSKRYEKYTFETPDGKWSS